MRKHCCNPTKRNYRKNLLRGLGTVADQVPHHGEVGRLVALGRQHEGGVTGLLDRVDLLWRVLQQLFDAGQVAVLGCLVYGAPTGPLDRELFGPSVQESFDNAGVPLLGGEPQRGGAVLLLGFDIDMAVYQQVDKGQVTILRS